MKKSSSVWKFFERLEENNKCYAVVCKLCESEYKFFGNTTNMRVHMINKHPIQWELSESGTLDESNLQKDETSPNIRTPRKRSTRTRTPREKNVGFSLTIDNEDTSTGKMPKIEIQRVDVDQSDSDHNDDTITLVRQMHGDQHSGEEWLEEDPYHITHIETYEPTQQKRRKTKYRQIKREVQSPTGLPGFYVAPKQAPNTVYEESNRKDEYSVFGEYIANKLRKLKAPRTRSNIQQLITTLMWQAEYGMYDNADAVKRVFMLSSQKEETQNMVFELQQPDQVIEQEEVVSHVEQSPSVLVANENDEV